jgi:glutamyl-Q tRNA(Asp) synthetase
VTFLASAQNPTPSKPQLTSRGRFAPSPTGPLHFGSLVAAVGSHLQTKSSRGEWLIRIEDLDTPRTQPGAADAILRTLEICGFEWDGAVVYQSARRALYENALALLRARALAYDCSCSRAEIQALVSADSLEDGELHYPGICRDRPRHPDRQMAARFRVPEHSIEFTDRLQGKVCLDLTDSIGDFVIKRRDGLFAYQLAVVIDDHEQGITEIVRGADLLYNTPRQIALQDALGFRTPTYAHLPVATDECGRKLSKSTAALEVDLDRPAAVLLAVFAFLNQSPPAELRATSVGEVWAWAKSHWNIDALTGIRAKEARIAT